MATESIFTKRRARHAGEMGLFPDNPMAGDDLALASEGEELLCRWHSERKIEALKFLWGLVDKVSQNTDRYLDKDKAMEDLKKRVGFAKLVFDHKTRELVLRARSLTQISNEELRAVTNKVMDVICAEIIPGMSRNQLRDEIEEMLGVKHR